MYRKFCISIFSIFLTEKIGLNEGKIGFFRMMAAVASIPGIILGGFLADYIGRKKVIVIFQGLAALCFIPCGFLGNSMLIPYLLILATFFGGAAHPANSAMITDLTNQENRKQAFALLYLGINIR